MDICVPSATFVYIRIITHPDLPIHELRFINIEIKKNNNNNNRKAFTLKRNLYIDLDDMTNVLDGNEDQYKRNKSENKKTKKKQQQQQPTKLTISNEPILVPSINIKHFELTIFRIRYYALTTHSQYFH